MPLVRFFQVTALFLVVFVGQLFIDGFHALTGANMFPYSEPLHLAIESYGPDGRYGQYLTYLLVLIPVGWLLCAGVYDGGTQPAAGAAVSGRWRCCGCRPGSWRRRWCASCRGREGRSRPACG